RAPSPAKRGQVEVHSDAIQGYRLLDGGGRDRHESALIGVTQYEQIAGDRIAEQAGREMGCIEKFRVVWAGRFGDALLHLAGRKFLVGVAGKLADNRLVVIDDRPALTRLQLRQGIGARRNNEITPQE